MSSARALADAGHTTQPSCLALLLASFHAWARNSAAVIEMRRSFADVMCLASSPDPPRVGGELMMIRQNNEPDAVPSVSS